MVLKHRSGLSLGETNSERNKVTPRAGTHIGAVAPSEQSEVSEVRPEGENDGGDDVRPPNLSRAPDTAQSTSLLVSQFFGHENC